MAHDGDRCWYGANIDVWPDDANSVGIILDGTNDGDDSDAGVGTAVLLVIASVVLLASGVLDDGVDGDSDGELNNDDDEFATSADNGDTKNESTLPWRAWPSLCDCECDCDGMVINFVGDGNDNNGACGDNGDNGTMSSSCPLPLPLPWWWSITRVCVDYQ